MTPSPVLKHPTPLNLGNATLDKIPQGICTPNYDRTALKCGIVHMSVGAFHRAHQCVYLDDLMNVAPDDWLIAGVGLLEQDKENIDKLAQQDGLFSVLERNSSSNSIRIVGTMKEVLHGPSDKSAIIARLRDPAIRILSLTITEKGYCYNQQTQLDEQHPLIVHDLANPKDPKSAIGMVVECLNVRRTSGLPGLTVLSCDNLIGNGHITKRIVTQFAALRNPDLATWISENVTFPNSMVDRITPATTQDHVDFIRTNYDVYDRFPVVCEDYRQWVIEDNFCQGRPALEQVGVQFVPDVEPYEKMKVRLLNGSHSALSYVSYLMGHRDVDKAVTDPLVNAFIKAYMDHDITPTLPDLPGIDLDAYKATLLRRFANASIRDQVLRLAEDGSQKIVNAIIPCIEYQLKNQGSFRYAAFAIAAWFRFLLGHDESLNPIPVKDPRAELLQTRAKIDPKTPDALLNITDIFGPVVGTSDQFRQAVAGFMGEIYTLGTKQALAKLLQSS